MLLILLLVKDIKFVAVDGMMIGCQWVKLPHKGMAPDLARLISHFPVLNKQK